MAEKTYFYLEWGGTADLAVEDIWPDGDAPENPTTADVIEAMKKEAGTLGFRSAPRHVAERWNLEIEDVEVSGPGGAKSLAAELRDATNREQRP